MFFPELLFKNTVVRKIRSELLSEKTIFLTFDDGPHVSCTDKLLDILKKNNAKATFFLIANNAKKFPDIARRIQVDGHSIGNHTNDHDTKHFFKNGIHLLNWIKLSEKEFIQLGLPPVAFRSPLGINTFPLTKVLLREKIPLVLWNHRFYDTRYELNEKKITKVLKKVTSGSIILLHDTQDSLREENFLLHVENLILKLQGKGYTLSSLNSSLIKKSLKI